MSDESPISGNTPSRRDFLTGKAIVKAFQEKGSELADSLIEAARALPPAAQDTVRLETRAMGCSWAVVMNPGPPRQVMAASDALQLVYGAENLLTVYRNDSETAVLNARAKIAPSSVSPELFEFLQLCQKWWSETQGAFDPGTGELIQLWKKAREDGGIPTEESVRTVLERGGMKNLELNPVTETVTFHSSGLLLDFGAIGKGYAVDLATSHLRSEQVEDFLIHGGQSSLYASGQHAPHLGWPVGIRNPLMTNERYATLLLHNEAISTSGSNVQFFRHDGKRYGHILDPRTGWPVNGLLSVTVIADSATVAEALSTAFYVMGLDKAVAYCENHPEVGAILVPHPVHGRMLDPVFCNVDRDRLFMEAPRT